MKTNCPCAVCGMSVPDGGYHPYLACLAFRGCRDGSKVEGNLKAVVERALKLGRAHVGVDEAMRVFQRYASRKNR